MARIPDEVIERLKQEVPIQRLVEARGIQLKRYGADLLGLCPFHEDHDPSLVVSPKNNLTQVTREQYSTPDPCQSETYYYDTSIDSGFPSGASWGKLTAVAFGYGTGGTGACPGTAADGSQWNGILYEYQYSSTGRTIGKRMVVTRNQVYGGPQQADLDAYWTYDNEGRMLSVQYPVAYDPDTGERTSTSYNYTYDNMGRAISMPNSPYSPYVSGVTYNASDQMTAISYFGTAESRTYNAMNQVATLSSGAVSETYNYVSGQNNGQISSVSEGSGETVGYTYDRLKRLISASSTYGWSQTYGYDGFGNMTYKSGSFSTLADPATNRLLYIGSYDANGNLYLGSWSYDFENRLVGVDAGGGERYMYDPSNKRIYKQNNSSGGAETYYFYGIDGKVLGEYTSDCASGDGCGTDGLTLNRVTESAYFAGKKVLPSVGRDRLGSVRTSGAANHPYGENYSQTNSDGFATYYQDSSTGLNYADQRYYNAVYGRFNTPDRYKAASSSANDPKTPQSWNKYPYAQGDPVNGVDPSGMYTCEIGYDPWCYAQPDKSVGRVGCSSSDDDSLGGDGETDKLMAASGCSGGGLGMPAPSPGQEGGGDPAPPQCSEWGCMPMVAARALQALTLNTKCMDDFGNAKTRAGAWNPANVLTELATQTFNHGSINFNYTGPDYAETSATSFLGLPGTTSKATISINPALWNLAVGSNNTVSNDTLTLLHEMAHLYDFVRAPGGFVLPNSAPDTAANSAFDTRLETDCNLPAPGAASI